ncbi:SPOR domain-containing protein [Pusillimonas sp. NJUB218]|uniref:SPOR domain-containing protein n=1 Tax=Pusillimonas sp. NJUB218 TaxID=2023230 RepID=UPI000F4C5EA3|nr:SPOR domain-containing protein [Pusillimonas sp. NJUB218]ROT45224.1 hypothetical protein CHR62_07985 [Pusillimonas sp. NJUB218]
MGFFSKGSDSSAGRRTSVRPAEAQANEMRVRARRRLVGALALVVAAVIVVPMLIDTDPPPGGPVSPIVVPAVMPPPDQALVDLANGAQGGKPGAITIEQLPEPEAPQEGAAATAGSAGTASSSSVAGSASGASASTGTASTASGASAPAGTSSSAPTAAPTQPAEPAKTPPARPDSRTDDGAVALALLEGRKPAAAALSTPSQSGQFVLQIAAYTTEQDAIARRNKLFEAGVTNAFVQSATAGGKPTFRLRVGPFPSREAAQAAQTRLRALGYDNGFISSK